jgi:hypothetical protein
MPHDSKTPHPFSETVVRSGSRYDTTFHEGGGVSVTLHPASCIPPAVLERRANGEQVDVDGWRKPRDLRDEALEDLRKQNDALRNAIEAKDAEIAQWTRRIRNLEERMERILKAAEG